MTPATIKELLAKAQQPSADALRLHPLYKGKLAVVPKCPIRSLEDFAVWYSPGVAAPCRDIAQHPEQVFAREATAVGMKAIEQGVAQQVLTEAELFATAEATIKHARAETHALMEAGIITTAEG